MKTKEDFCGACLAVPLALVGGSTALASKNSHKQRKKIIFFVGLAVTLLSFVLGLIFLMKCKKCR